MDSSEENEYENDFENDFENNLQEKLSKESFPSETERYLKEEKKKGGKK